MAFDYAALVARLQARGYLPLDAALTNQIDASTVIYRIELDRIRFNLGDTPRGAPEYVVTAGVAMDDNDDLARESRLETAAAAIIDDLRALSLLPIDGEAALIMIDDEGNEMMLKAVAISFRDLGTTL